MPIPLLLLTALLLLALLLALAHRLRTPIAARATAVAGALGGGGLTAWLATLTLTTAAGAPLPAATWAAADFTLALTPSLRALSVLLLAGWALLALLKLRFPRAPLQLPAALAALAPLLAALMITPVTLGAVLLVISAALLVVALQPHAWDGSGSVLRFLLLTTLAAPLLIVAGWLPAAAAGAVLPTAHITALAAALLLGGFPFYTWMRPLMARASPLAALLLLGLVPPALAAYVLPLRAAVLPTADALWQLSGLGTVLAAALLAVTAVTLRDLWAAVTLLDVGLCLLALLLPGDPTSLAALSPFLLRGGGLLLSGAGLLLIEETGLPARLHQQRANMRQRPLAAALFLYGCFSLVGAPLTPGFVGRWALLAGWGATAVPWWLVVLALLALAIVVYQLLRLLVNGLQAPAGESMYDKRDVPRPQQ